MFYHVDALGFKISTLQLGKIIDKSEASLVLMLCVLFTTLFILVIILFFR